MTIKVTWYDLTLQPRTCIMEDVTRLQQNGGEIYVWIGETKAGKPLTHGLTKLEIINIY